jgi:endonuclease-3 related protein
MDDRALGQALIDIYRRLLDRFGPQHWWPAEEPFEVIVGAILTQSAAWGNVERAIDNLKRAEALSPGKLRRLQLPRLAKLVHPCGYYNAKALKLKSFAFWLGNHYADDLDRLFASDTDDLRRQLLSVHGVGQETADSILLYAAGKPVFVIDAYTRRILSRIGLGPEKDSYAGCQAFFMDNLTADTELFNEYHALLVRLGKDVCRRRPLCPQCCLNDMCQLAAANLSP